jgi:phosphoenolpyruvate carboxylase
MTTIEEKEMAADMLQMAAEDLANQRERNGESYRRALQEMEDCLKAVRTLEKRLIEENSKP